MRLAMLNWKRFLGVLFSATILFAMPAVAASSSPSLKRVAFVFDDGPTTEHLNAFLELFAREQVRVNFSFVGRNVAAHPELTRATVERGHEINNHSYTHPHLVKLSDEEILAEIKKTSTAIQEATGKPPAWFWAPFLESNERVEAQLQKLKLVAFPYAKYRFISTSDWDSANTTAETIRKSATTGVVDGTVILFHEWRSETLQEMPAILRELRRQGCTFVTFSELAAALPDGVGAAR